LDYVLGGESLDGLPVKIMYWSELWGGGHLENGNKKRPPGL
jgi:hypothetical protein